MMKPDTVIIGGGSAGAACALMLARAGVNCTIFERNPQPVWKPGEIINSQVQFLLHELGLWKQFNARGYLQSAGVISSWGGDIFESNSAFNPYGGAFLVDRVDLEEMLLNAAQENGVEVIRGTQVKAAERIGDNWEVEVRGDAFSGVKITPLLIEASGRGRSVVGAGERLQFDSLVALLSYVAIPDSSIDLRLCIEAAENGWWYSATLPNRRMVLAFLTDADILPRGRAAHDCFFRQQLENSVITKKSFTPEKILPDFHITSAKSTIRRFLGGKGWIALGDAAATYDPITGMGVAVAISKGIALARLILSKGLQGAINEYLQAERTGYANYLRARKSLYCKEQRWQKSLFWRRRIGSV